MHVAGAQLGRLRTDAFCFHERFLPRDRRNPQGMGIQGPCLPPAQGRVQQGSPGTDSQPPELQGRHDRRIHCDGRRVQGSPGGRVIQNSLYDKTPVPERNGGSCFVVMVNLGLADL